MDPLFLTGVGAGNPVSAVDGSTTESLTAHGLGTLGTGPLADRGVTAKGAWEGGVYKVVFRRPLAQNDGENPLNLEPGKVYFVAFACWDGSAGDRGGQKNVTIAHRLQIETNPR